MDEKEVEKILEFLEHNMESASQRTGRIIKTSQEYYTLHQAEAIKWKCDDSIILLHSLKKHLTNLT